MVEFYEQFQTKNYGRLQQALNLISNIMLILALVSLVVLGSIGNAIIMILGYACISLIIRNILVEYEYELTLNEIVITKIIDKRKRKKLLVIDVKNIEKVTDIFDAKGKCRYINASLKGGELKERYVHVKNDNKLIVINMAMDKGLLSICKRINPMSFNSL